VEHSVIFSGVYVAEGARVIDSIVMSDSRIGRNSFLDRVIVDKQVIVEDKVYLGKEDESWKGESITVVGKNCHIPSGTVVGRGCRIGPDLAVEDFHSVLIKSGTVLKKAGYSEGLK
ncbi:MAG: glucose-1-phosphate adenylyltransferase, partial [Candidatus Atribacteria bacterium]|nr:glucose-1-phosphate adenylyltransferase [Candidatus Atribacteria bacterium]MCD6349287.1 glucose-1-phosphate adenylyltransferase [Candidatus Atribacteria bacterium]